jgi:UDP-N-acetylmuramoylalanine--D-glutamate ligase
MELEGHSVIVVGLGRSGIAAARLCAARGARVTVTDSAPLEALPAAVQQLEATIVCGGHEGVAFERADLVVVSPGVPPLAALDRAERAGVSVVGELELAWRMTNAPTVAVGGTNGKSTTTMLVGAMLEQTGKRTFVGGNLGTPLSEVVDQPWDLLVLEVSSFQMERAPQFRPRASILLNVSEDHLDRYPSFEAYARAKGNAFVNQGPDDVAIVPAGDRVCIEQARRGRGRLVTFGRDGAYAIEPRLVIERASGERFSLEGVALHGWHNFENAAAASAAARALGADRRAIEQGLRGFQPLPHRMALAGVVGGVPFYDDSKGTNVGAALTALRGLGEQRGVLIAGGRDKLGSYDPLVRALADKGRAAVLIGEAADRIAAAIGGVVPVVRAGSMDEAVRAAHRLAQPGDAVLLSPACSSFDMFRSYAERGAAFAASVRALAGERGEQEKTA